jgi:hypothetical protein
LEKDPSAEVRVYAVWFNVLSGDNKGAWDASLLNDDRVTEYWDGDINAGPWFAENLPFDHGPLAWDVYYLFGADARWEEAPAPLVSYGYTLLNSRERLRSDLQALLDEQKAAIQ